MENKTQGFRVVSADAEFGVMRVQHYYQEAEGYTQAWNTAG